MARAIPKDEEVVAAITKVLAQHPLVRTQHELADLVQRELGPINPEYAVGGERVRRLAIRSGFAAVEIETRAGSFREEHKDCPVCGSKVSRVQNKTLEGKRTTVALRCRRCGFHSGTRAPSVPARYTFRARK